MTYTDLEYALVKFHQLHRYRRLRQPRQIAERIAAGRRTS